MKVIEAQKILYEDIKNILESAGLKNGLGADKTESYFIQLGRKQLFLAETHSSLMKSTISRKQEELMKKPNLN